LAVDEVLGLRGGGRGRVEEDLLEDGDKVVEAKEVAVVVLARGEGGEGVGKVDHLEHRGGGGDRGHRRLGSLVDEKQAGGVETKVGLVQDDTSQLFQFADELGDDVDAQVVAICEEAAKHGPEVVGHDQTTLVLVKVKVVVAFALEHLNTADTEAHRTRGCCVGFPRLTEHFGLCRVVSVSPRANLDVHDAWSLKVARQVSHHHKSGCLWFRLELFVVHLLAPRGHR